VFAALEKRNVEVGEEGKRFDHGRSARKGLRKSLLAKGKARGVFFGKTKKWPSRAKNIKPAAKQRLGTILD
jgi:hypothetical protein